MPPPSVPFRLRVGFGQQLKINNVIVRAEGRKNLPLVSQPPPPPNLPLKKSPTRSPPQKGFSSTIKAPKAFFCDIQAIDVGGTPFLSSSLCVGDIDFRVTNSQLRRVFMKMGRVVSVRVCREMSIGRSLGYGYVNYGNITDG
ncbi:hypothetical protein Dsin_027574 [Dipteronia sinensis]|uniref:RRM domain-containing protein n=1 Tax=Dipteronia sinensis TaxID=43782 RepID=A0AAD9ZP09_9ROSI|nr:hypothetical protein Dsin_027574 [Dipteronia sinensis]